MAQEIVTDAEAEIEAVEPILRKHGKVLWPHVAIVEPRFIFGLASEEALNAANAKSGLCCDRLRQSRRGNQGGGCLEKVAAFHYGSILQSEKELRLGYQETLEGLKVVVGDLQSF